MSKEVTCPVCGCTLPLNNEGRAFCETCKITVTPSKIIATTPKGGYNPENVEITARPCNNFDLFEDRANSLLERWRYFHDKYIAEGNEDLVIKMCIDGFIHEITDDFTKGLMK